MAVPQSRPQDAESNVLVLYTGGTIGMLRTSEGFAPAPGFLYDHLRTQSRFHDPEGSGIANHAYSQDAYRAWASAGGSPRPKSTNQSSPASRSEVDVVKLSDCLSKASIQPSTLEVITAIGSKRLPSLISPRNRTGKRIRYVVFEYDELIDSCDLALHHWKTIAQDIERNYSHFDAFLILHGTDTMAYTASALSFMLENLGKTVIVTGAQIPLSELRNDAVDNLLGAMSIARDYLIPEVCLFFHHKLYRGCRTTKTSAADFEAFTSPNLPHLASTGIEVHIDWDNILRPTALKPFKVHDCLEGNIAVISLYPGIPASFITAALQPPLKGVILRTYGSGNAPQRDDLISAFAEASARGVVIINITQCTRGAVSANYASGQKLAVEAGVVSGLDMTVEAAYAKLSYLLGRPDLNQDERRQLIGRPLRGELTPPIVAQFKHSEADDKLHQLLLQTVDLHGSLNESRCSEMVTGNRLAEQEVHVIHDTLLPILLASAAGRSDGNLEKLLDQNHPVPLEVLNASGAVMRSPLHVAIQTGLLQNVAKLLAAGASVHLRDVALNCSALRLAASQGHVEIVRALLQAGAHLTETELQAVGAEVQQARTLGRQDLLEAWSEILTHAGVDRSVN